MASPYPIRCTFSYLYGRCGCTLIPRLCGTALLTILGVMKLDSKFFDSIRVASRRPPLRREEPPRCQWKGCPGQGLYRAPKGRNREGQYYLFCIDHIRDYNASYNYFEGMSDPEVEDYQRDAATGHRPTWRMGAGASGPGLGAAAFRWDDGAGLDGRAADPHGFFARRAREKRAEPLERRRHFRPLERKALDTLELGETSTREEIKARFKELVKRHHPDLNGGDCRSEDRLREIIQAYNLLKQAGLT